MVTTAQQLIAYRNELIDGGLHPSYADEIIKDAAQTLVMNHGLRVTLPTDQDTAQR